MKIIYFDIATLLLLATLLALMFFKKINRRSHKIFMFMILELFFTTVFSLASICLDNAGPGNELWKFSLHGLYLLGHMTTIMLVLLYIVSISDVMFRLWKSAAFGIMIFAPVGIYHALLIINIFVPIMYHIDAAGVYTRDFLFPIGYAIGLLYFVELGYAIVKCRKIINWSAVRALMILFPLTAASMIVEFIWSNIVIEPFFNAIAYLVMFVNIAKPDTYTDSVTGVSNEEAFKMKIKQAFANKKPCKVILVEAVNYLSIAELLGGHMFEEFNKYVANKLKEIDKFCKTSMFISHLGSGKFRVIVEESHYNTLQLLVDNIFHQLGKRHVFGDVVVEPIPAVAVLSCPDDIDDVDKYLFFSSSFPSYSEGVITYSHELLNDRDFMIKSHIDQIIDNAIRNNWMDVYFQPIYDTKTKRFVTAEALLRMKDPEYGWIDTETMVKAAEKSGAIHKIGEIVFRKTLSFMSSKEYKELKLNGLDINISVAECLDKLMPKKLDSLLKEFGIDVNEVNLEITETAATLKVETFIKNVNALHDMGVKVSLDDFGSGYSNVRRMVYLPFNTIKFDRSLVLLDDTPDGHKVVSHLINMVKEMGYKIVVEGVEEEKQLESFIGFGADLIQGWYFSKALPPEEFIKFVKEHNG